MKEQLLEPLPNAFISEAVGVLRERLQRAAPASTRTPRRTTAGSINVDHGPEHRSCSTTTTGPVAPGEVGRLGARRQRAARLLQGPGEDGGDVHRDRRQALLRPRRLRPSRRGRQDDAARPRLAAASTPAGRRSIPRRSRLALKAHPDVYDVLVVGVADETLGPEGRRGRAAPRRALAGRSTICVEHCRTPHRRATRCRARCTSSTRSRAQPPASPTTRAPRTASTRWRSPHEEPSRGDVRDRVPDLRVLPLPRRRRRGHERRRHGRARLRCAFSPDQLELELNWIDEHVGGKPYGVDVVMPVKTADRDAGIHEVEDIGAQLRTMISQDHWDYVDKILADHGVDMSDGEGARIGRGPGRRCARLDRGDRRAADRDRPRAPDRVAGVERSVRRRRRPSIRRTSRA